MAMSTWNPDNYIVTLGGVRITGFDRGTFMEVAWTSPLFTEKTDISGKLVRSKTNDFSAIVTLTLEQSSLSNAYLTALMEKDKLTGSGAGVFAVIDLNGDSFYSSSQAYVKQSPNAVAAAESSPRAWQIVCAHLRAAELGLPLDDIIA